MLNYSSNSTTPSIAAVQSGSGTDLQTKLDELVAELATTPGPNNIFLGAFVGGAGDGSQFACSVLYGAPSLPVFSSTSVQDPIALTSFASAVPTTNLSRILVAEGGTAEEANEALTAAITEAKTGAISSANCNVADYAVVGSSNGQRWLAMVTLVQQVLAP